jgi:hypothetical protein
LYVAQEPGLLCFAALSSFIFSPALAGLFLIGEAFAPMLKLQLATDLGGAFIFCLAMPTKAG